MATQQIQTTVGLSKDVKENSDLLTKVKWLFKKWNNWWSNNKKRTKAFTLTRRDSIISVLVALVVAAWAIIYGWIVLKKYKDINDNIDPLRKISTYEVVLDKNILEPYAEWSNLETIDDVIKLNENVEEVLTGRQMFRDQQKNYYEILLQNIYLPSLNVWKNPYTKNFDMSVLWQKYLEKDKFQDLYLIQYWSDFVKYVWNDADYNTIDNITIWDIVELDGAEYFYIPITVSFSSPNKRSFLLLVNKLSMTSNTANIALLNEFFFYLLRDIKDDKAEIIDNLMEKYRTEFSSSSNRTGWDSYSALWDKDKSNYMDKVIWYNLYKWINNEEETPLIDDKIIVKAIRETVLCEDSKSNLECFYQFRDKYRNLPYLAYRIWLDQSWEITANSTNRTEWLKEFLQDLPSIIAITNFGFDKYSEASYLNDKEEQYEWVVTFNAYWRTISDSELKEASTELWKLCFWINSNSEMTPKEALSRVEKNISSLWWMNKNSNVTSLLELQDLFRDIEKNYNSMSNYNKMIKIFELRRMLNDANLCNV